MDKMAKGKHNHGKEALTELGNDIVADIRKKKNPTINLPVRALSNVSFDTKKKSLVLGNKVAERSFFNVAHAKKFLQTVEVASVAKELLQQEKHASLRDVIYMAKRTIPGTKINIVDEQVESDGVIEDLELITGASREQLHMTANKMGSVVGNVTIEDAGDTIHWDKLGSGGYSVPSSVEDIKFKDVKANYILYMEKAAVWQRFYEEYKLPIYVLCDNDPYGYWIYFVIKYGSINLAGQSERLTIPGVKYLGITCDDIEKYDLKKHFIKMKDTDHARLKQIAEYPWLKDDKHWQRQFKMMKQMDAKVEIQSLSSKGISFISESYLPSKIKNKEFLD